MSPPVRIVQAIVHGDLPFPALSAEMSLLLRSCLSRDSSLRPSASSVAEQILGASSWRERLAALLSTRRLSDAPTSFATSHPDQALVLPPNYVSKPVQPVVVPDKIPEDSLVSPATARITAPAATTATLAAAPEALAKQAPKEEALVSSIKQEASPKLPALVSSVAATGVVKKSKTEPQLVAINSNSEVSPQMERVPVVLPFSAQEAKRKVASAFSAFPTPVDMIAPAAQQQQQQQQQQPQQQVPLTAPSPVPSPELGSDRSSEVKQIGKFTVTTTTPTAAVASSQPSMAKQRSFTNTHGKFTVTTTQLAGPAQVSAPQESWKVLELLIIGQKEQSRQLSDLVRIVSKNAEELKALREENATLKAMIQQQQAK